MASDRVPQLFWEHELTTTSEPQPLEWIWDGFVARGCLTLLTSQWKAGKTTLVSLLLARRGLPHEQKGSLAGLAVQPGKTVIITEEDRRLWAERVSRQGFGGQVCFFPQPFHALPRQEEWQALLERILQLQGEHGIDLLVIDPLAHFLRCENNTASVLESIMPLRELTRRGMAVLVLHHPSKSRKSLGHASRGSGSLLGHADIIVEMRHPGGDAQTRRRRFLAISRYQRTPARLLLELNADGSDYFPVIDAAADDFLAHWHILEMVLSDVPQKVTRRDVLLEWPEDFDKPDPRTLHRWLDRALNRQLILREGTGRKMDPYRYWLPGMVEVWKEQQPCYDIVEYHTRTMNLRFKPLHLRECDKAADERDAREDEFKSPLRSVAYAERDEADDEDMDESMDGVDN